jgi:hypothetical protein
MRKKDNRIKGAVIVRLRKSNLKISNEMNNSLQK